jgi:hypothetical protein
VDLSPGERRNGARQSARREAGPVGPPETTRRGSRTFRAFLLSADAALTLRQHHALFARLRLKTISDELSNIAAVSLCETACGLGPEQSKYSARELTHCWGAPCFGKFVVTQAGLAVCGLAS